MKNTAKNLTRKIISVLISASLTFEGSFFTKNTHAEQATPDSLKNHFMTTKDLIQVAGLNNGKGPLSTGYTEDQINPKTEKPGTDKEVTLALGQYAVTQYFDRWNGEDFDKRVPLNGPIAWYLVGAENNDLVLFSKYPLLAEDRNMLINTPKREDGLMSRFVSFYVKLRKTPYGQSTANQYYYNSRSVARRGEGSDSHRVYANDWEFCDLRSNLRKMTKPDLNWFTQTELDLMGYTTVKTIDLAKTHVVNTDCYYTTTDILYPASGIGNHKSIYEPMHLGSEDQLDLSVKYMKDDVWLRSPYNDSVSLVLYVTSRYGCIDNSMGNNYTIAAAAGFRLKTSEIKFVSSVSTKEITGESLVDLEPNSPLYIKLKDKNEIFKDTKLTAENSSLSIKNVPTDKKVNLAVLLANKTQGTIQRYVQPIESDDIIDLSKISNISIGSEYEAISWLESPDESENSSLAYVTDPIVFSFDTFNLQKEEPSDTKESNLQLQVELKDKNEIFKDTILTSENSSLSIKNVPTNKKVDLEVLITNKTQGTTHRYVQQIKSDGTIDLSNLPNILKDSSYEAIGWLEILDDDDIGSITCTTEPKMFKFDTFNIRIEEQPEEISDIEEVTDNPIQESENTFDNIESSIKSDENNSQQSDINNVSNTAESGNSELNTDKIENTPITEENINVNSYENISTEESTDNATNSTENQVTLEEIKLDSPDNNVSETRTAEAQNSDSQKNETNEIGESRIDESNKGNNTVTSEDQNLPPENSINNEIATNLDENNLQQSDINNVSNTAESENSDKNTDKIETITTSVENIDVSSDENISTEESTDNATNSTENQVTSEEIKSGTPDNNVSETETIESQNSDSQKTETNEDNESKSDESNEGNNIVNSDDQNLQKIEKTGTETV